MNDEKPKTVADDVKQTAERIRTWLVQSYRYSASTIELDDVLVREMNALLLRTMVHP